MGTRAIYQFRDGDDECFVYKHYDNYPQGAVHFIEAAKGFAWKLPRFEADEFASAFVAANKNKDGGEVRLVSNHFNGEDDILDAHSWCDYYYTVYFNRLDGVQALCVEVMESFYQKDGSVKWETIWEGTHDEMMEEYGRGAA